MFSTVKWSTWHKIGINLPNSKFYIIWGSCHRPPVLKKPQIFTLQLNHLTWNSSIIDRFYTSGLYYKHVTIVNDDSSIISKWSFKLSDDPRVVIYDCHTFIIQATDGWILVRRNDGAAISNWWPYRASPTGHGFPLPEHFFFSFGVRCRVVFLAFLFLLFHFAFVVTEIVKT